MGGGFVSVQLVLLLMSGWWYFVDALCMLILDAAVL